MNIQEFSHQLGQERHPSRLIRALRELRGLDVNRFSWSKRMGPNWGVWNEQEPRTRTTASK